MRINHTEEELRFGRDPEAQDCFPRRGLMHPLTLTDLHAWNDQLAALIEAGVPLDIRLGAAEQPTAVALERINATIARRVSRGESLAEAVQGDEQDIPASYRGLVELVLTTGDPAAALDSTSHVAEAATKSRDALTASFIYPLIVCCLAYLGLIGFCIYLVPTLLTVYGELGYSPGWGLRVLESLRIALPYWAPILPIVLLFFAWRLVSRSREIAQPFRRSPLLNRLPWISRALFEERCARFSSSAAELLERGATFQEAVRVAGDQVSNGASVSGSGPLVETAEDPSARHEPEAAAQPCPPFLRWALWQSEATVGRARALRIAASLYRDAAARHLDRLGTLVPLIVLVLVGGSVTLLYCLALFIPVVQLLLTLANPSA